MLPGPETTAVTYAAETMGKIMEKPINYTHAISGTVGYLSNAAKAFSLFGYPRVPMPEMLRLQAEWLMNGGRSLNKPTHFEVNNGKF